MDVECAVEKLEMFWNEFVVQALEEAQYFNSMRQIMASTGRWRVFRSLAGVNDWIAVVVRNVTKKHAEDMAKSFMDTLKQSFHIWLMEQAIRSIGRFWSY